jgi:hypothetical protein
MLGTVENRKAPQSGGAFERIFVKVYCTMNSSGASPPGHRDLNLLPVTEDCEMEKNRKIDNYVRFLKMLNYMRKLNRPIVRRPLPLALAELCARDDAATTLYPQTEFAERIRRVENEAAHIRSTSEYAEAQNDWRAPCFNQDTVWGTRAVLFQGEVGDEGGLNGIAIATSPHSLVAKPLLTLMRDDEGNSLGELLRDALNEQLALHEKAPFEIHAIPVPSAANPLSIWIVWPQSAEAEIEDIADVLQAVLNDKSIEAAYCSVIERAMRRVRLVG